MALPCGNSNATSTADNNQASELQSWAWHYGDTNSCNNANTNNSPFRISSKSPTNTANRSTEVYFLWWGIQIKQDPILSASENSNLEISIDGVRIQGVADIKNKLLWWNEKGIKKILMGWIENQIEYIKNNLLRRHLELYLPDSKHISKQIWSLNEGFKTISESSSNNLFNKITNFKNLTSGVDALRKNREGITFKKEYLENINLSNGDNPFDKLKMLFNQSDLISITSKDVVVNVPRIYSEDIEAYGNYLQSRAETMTWTVNARTKRAQHIILSCPKDLKALFKSGDQVALEKKQRECNTAQDVQAQMLRLTAKFDKIQEQIFENLEILHQYKKFPLEIYERLHVTDRYIAEVSGMITNFFGYINYWMDINANRFSQYVDAIVTILAVVKTYQVLIDFSANRTSKCGTCTNDTYDQYTCKLAFLCGNISPDPIPIPNIKIPNLTVDLSNLDLGLQIVLPHFRFVPQSIDLPRLPNLPPPPQIWMELNLDFDIWDLPILPEPPTLPELPSLLPQVKMNIPILPPAPKIPEIPKAISSTLDIATKIGKIYCIIKSGIWLVGESSVKARIEQMTQRNYDVPRVDHLDLTTKRHQTPLQGVDYQIDSFVNLQYNFDAFYAFLKSITDELNKLSYAGLTAANNITSEMSDGYSYMENELNNMVKENMNLNLKVEGKLTTDDLKKAAENTIQELQKATTLGHAWPNTTKTQLSQQLNKILPELHSSTEQEAVREILALTQKNTTVTTNHQGLSTLQNKLTTLIHRHQNQTNTRAELAKNDYKNFLLAATSTKNTEKPLQLTRGTNLLNTNDEANKLISNTNINDAYIRAESKNIEGYLLALENNSPERLRMSQTTHQNSKAYLKKISNEIKNYHSLKTTTYPGQSPLLSKDGTSQQKVLLTQTKPAVTKISTSASDYSDFVEWILIKSNDKKALINVVNSSYNYKKYQHHYQKDMNNDKKADLIARDENNIYIKYADDAETRTSSKNTKYYLLSPTLKNRAQKYETIHKESFKLYDSLAEVKNFSLKGQTFDTLSFWWTHTPSEQLSWYLMRTSDRIDSMREKFNPERWNYVLFLPQGTSTTGVSLTLDGKTHTLTSLINNNRLYTIKYYNPSNITLNFGISELPRSRQYLQISTLQLNKQNYSQNSPRSNQVLGGRQIIADTEPPRPSISLIRSKKNLVVDEGNQLEGFVGTYYDLEVEREDNVQVGKVSISEGTGMSHSTNIAAPKWKIRLQNLFFTGNVEKTYNLFGQDSEGNQTQDTINLSITTPGISIEKITRFSGRREGIENPILITSMLETDIDKWDVNFQRQRNNTLKTISATQGWKSITNFPVTTDQTTVTGAYFDFGDLIGLYNQSGTLLGTVNAQNWEILFEKQYQSGMHLELDFSKSYPLIKVFQNTKALFDILLTPQEIIDFTIKKGTILPLTETKYWLFNGGKALMIENTPYLYISPTGQLSTNKNLHGSYHFNTTKKTVIYTIKEHRFGEEIATLELKTLAL